MKTAIIVDSTSYLPTSLYEAHDDLFVISMTVNFPDGQTLVDSNLPSALRDFFETADQYDTLPTTSQPAADNYIKLLQKIKDAGYERVFALHMPRPLSGAVETAQLVAKEFEDQMEVHIIDTRRISVVVHYMVEEIFKALEQGATTEEVLQLIQYIGDKSVIYLAMDTLDNIEKGGRLSATGAKIGSLMKIKPIAVIDGPGEIHLKKIVRGHKKARRKIVQLIQEAEKTMPEGIRILLTHAEAKEEVEALLGDLLNVYPDRHITIDILGPVVATHTGPGSYGIGVVPRI